MGKSPAVVGVDEVQAALRVALKPKGFRKQGRTFNRTTTDGLIQVMNLQMGAFDPPGYVPIPALSQSFYGSFTVNLGVYVPEVARLLGYERNGIVQEYHCCVRSRLGELGPERGDIWWRADQPAQAAHDVLMRLERDGLPFLELFGSRDALLAEWKNKSDRVGTDGTAPRIVLAAILAERGAKDAAHGLLAEQVRDNAPPAHAEHVRSLATRLGLAPLPQ
jgi:Domain of unknown function (DUF4304)